MESFKKFKIATLGCRTNQYESAAYAKQLIEMGYVEAKEEEAASVCVVNTCTVTQGADVSSRQQIRQLIRKNPGSKVLVTGCLADRLPKEIGEIEGVSYVVLNKDKETLLTHLFPSEPLPEFAIDHFGGHTRAFVKIQDGCNSYCTYCIIPYVRGRSRSRSLESIVKEIEGLIQKGYKEVVLTGINIGDFDGAPKEGEPPLRLWELVKRVDAIEGLERLRISSIDPDEVDEDLLNVVAEGKRTCPSMHIVLQSGSNAILKRMNRKYTRQVFLDTIHRLKKASKDFTFTTDVIVGFPGETQTDFEETLALIKEVRFAKVHMFPFSPRERTRAALYPNQLSPLLIKERKTALLHLSEQVAFELRQDFVGRKMSVLIEAKEEEGFFSGHTENFLEVKVQGKNLSSHTLCLVELTENTPTALIGKVCGSK